MGKSNTALRILLLVFCVANVIWGIVGLMGGEAAVKAAAWFYGANVTLTPQISYIIRMLGAFVLIAGLLGGVAALDPVKNKAIISCIIILLVLRVLQRIIFAKEIFEAFGITNARNLSNIIFFLAIAIALYLLRPKAEKA